MTTVEKIQNAYKNNKDFMTRQVDALGTTFNVFFLSSLCNEQQISMIILTPLIEAKTKEKPSYKSILKLLPALKPNELKTTKEAIDAVAGGSCIIVCEKFGIMLQVGLKTTPARPIATPITSPVARGPREGFVEDFQANLAVIQNKIKSPKLCFDEVAVGEMTKTRVGIFFIKGIADEKVVKQIKEKIKKIEIDGVLDSYYIQQHLAKKPKSIFKQAGVSERTDVVTSKILEGRVAILVEGSPFVLTLPYIMIEDLQAPEDYYEEPAKVTFMRWLRVLGIFVCILLPGMFLSFILFHYKSLPLGFLMTVLNETANVPFTPLAEMLLVFLIFEILHEASFHIPQGFGTSFGIVGAIILSNPLISSNLASVPVVLIVAASSVALYLIANQTSTLRLLRLGFILLGAMFGIVGIVLGIICTIAYLSDFDSYGASYLGPYAPLVEKDLRDAITKQTLMGSKNHPQSLGKKNKSKEDKNDKK